MNNSRFQQDGYCIEPQVYSADELELIRQAIASNQHIKPCVWEKGLCASSRHFLNLASHPSILKRIRDLLGEHVVLWGGVFLKRRPGDIHYWHTDIESSHPEGGFVSAWIGVEGTGKETALQLVPGSHQFGKPLQQAMQENGKTRKTTTEADINTWSSALHQLHSEIVQPEVRDGDAIFFDGRLWHGSNNRTTETTRTALLFQYARADIPVRIPDFTNLQWPFTFHETPRPPCIQVAGTAEPTINRMVEKPPIIDRELKPLGSKVFSIQPTHTSNKKKPFKAIPLFDSRSSNLVQISSHYSLLDPGHSPHPPHAHIDEEILILLQGRANLRYDDGTGAITDHMIEAGEGVYYPSLHRHTIHNPGDEPIIYVMFKWIGSGSNAQEPLELQRIRVEPLPEKMPSETGLKTERCFKGPTWQLTGIEAHISTIHPNGGYEPHCDEHDVAILVFEGEIETNGQRLQRGQLAWHDAGVDHDMWNRSDQPARYLVIEFHGENCSGDYLSFTHPDDRRQKGLFKKRSSERILRNIKRILLRR